jgi:hypothetical protein
MWRGPDNMARDILAASICSLRELGSGSPEPTVVIALLL